MRSLVLLKISICRNKKRPYRNLIGRVLFFPFYWNVRFAALALNGIRAPIRFVFEIAGGTRDFSFGNVHDHDDKADQYSEKARDG